MGFRSGQLTGCDRRAFLALAGAVVAAGGVGVVPASAQSADAASVSEELSPLEPIAPVASDGHEGVGFLRKPPGDGPFPAMVMLHPGLNEFPVPILQTIARGSTASRFLAAGYVVLVPTYRSRDVDPLTPTTIDDSLAAVAFAKTLPYVDASSVVVFGCSGGGDLALEVAAATEVCAIACEEPASMMFTGVFDKNFPKAGETFTPMDSIPIGQDPLSYYTPALQELTRAKIARITCPILIVMADPPVEGDFASATVGPFNNAVLIPELRAAGKDLKVIDYTAQLHCFCFSGGDPAPIPIPPPDDYPAVARAANRDVDSFFRTWLPTQPAAWT